MLGKSAEGEVVRKMVAHETAHHPENITRLEIAALGGGYQHVAQLPLALLTATLTTLDAEKKMREKERQEKGKAESAGAKKGTKPSDSGLEQKLHLLNTRFTRLEAKMSAKRPRCGMCGKPGHTDDECWHRDSKERQPRDAQALLQFALVRRVEQAFAF
jgi:hypothetical protein